jgi:hypothetical protein
MMWTLTAEDSSSAIVLPLSVAYSSKNDVRVARNALQKSGTVHMAFYDRAPDSLFGDDVKTRAAVVFLKRDRTNNEPRLFATRLQRWSSASRDYLFSRERFIEIPAGLRRTSIPKVQEQWELELLEAIDAGKAGVAVSVVSLFDASDVSSMSSDERLLCVLLGATAYNYLPVRPLVRLPEDSIGVGSSWWGMKFATEMARWAAFAILCSPLTYWYWRVMGDGFHLTKKFVLSLPFSIEALAPVLSDVGRRIWGRISGRPIRSINKGRETVSYSPLGEAGDLRVIDRILLEWLGMREDSDALLRLQRQVIAAGRERQPRVQHHGQ